MRNSLELRRIEPFRTIDLKRFCMRDCITELSNRDVWLFTYSYLYFANCISSDLGIKAQKEGTKIKTDSFIP